MATEGLATLFILEEMFDSDEENDNVFENDLIMDSLICAAKRNVPKVHDFEATVELFADIDFRAHFRIDRNTFHSILNRISHLLIPMKNCGVEPVSPEKQLCIFLWYICNQCAMREISNLFGVSLSTVHSCIRRVSSALCSIRDSIIRWPSVERQAEISVVFEEVSTIQGICGAIDGTHIRLAGAPKEQRDYYNRKKFPSLQLQLVVDSNLVIMDTYCGWPGSTHDARVLRNSPLYDKIEQGDFVGPDLFLIGDSAYPLRQWLLTPFKNIGNLTPAKRRYNKALSSARQCVERAIGQLKSRFRRLQCVDSADVHHICRLITSACVLHNICIFENDELVACLNEDNRVNNYPAIYRNAAGGVRRRNEVLAYF